MAKLILTFLLIALTTPLLSHAGDILIGVSLSLTGKYSKMGIMQKNGFELWEDLTNQHGGILNKKIVLRIYDDKSDPRTARNLYSKMIKENVVDLVFGPYSSAISKAILPVTEKHKFPVLLSGASADSLWEQNYEYAFGVYTPASKYTVGFLEMLTRNKIRRIAILSAKDPFSLSLSKSTKKWAQKFMLKIVLNEKFQPGADYTRLIAKARQNESQAIIVCGHLRESIAISRALDAIKWKPRAYYSSVGPATETYYKALGTKANLVFSSSQWEPSVGIHFPRGREFIGAFTNRFKLQPSYHAATAFAAGMILQEAVDITGSIDKQLLKKTFSSMDTTTLIGRYGVDRSGRQIRHFPLIIQWQNGKKRVVWPEKLKNADPIFN